MRSFPIVALALMFLFLMAMPAISDNSSAIGGTDFVVGAPAIISADDLNSPNWIKWYDSENLYAIEINLSSIDMRLVDEIVFTFDWLDSEYTAWQINARPSWRALGYDYGSGEMTFTRADFADEAQWNATTSIILDSSGTGTIVGASFTAYGFPEYSTIQSALDLANTGDTIQVLPGYYAEVLNSNQTVNIIGEPGTEIWMQGGSLTLDTFNVTDLTMSNGSIIITNEINGDSLVMNGTSTLSSYSVNFTSTTLLDSAEIIILEYPPTPPSLTIFPVLIGLFVIVGIVITVLGSDMEMEEIKGILGAILVLATVTITVFYL